MSAMTSAQRSALRRALESTTRTAGLASDLRELAYDLVAELSQDDATRNRYFDHNLAVFVASVAADAALADAVGPLGAVAAPVLDAAMSADGDDLAIPLAFASAPTTVTSAARVTAIAAAARRPHAGDRLVATVSEALARLAAAPPSGEVKAAIPEAARQVLERLDGLLAREPDREHAVQARLALLGVVAADSGGQQQIDAYERLESLFEAAERHFGPAPERGALRLNAVCHRLGASGVKTPKPLVAAAVRTATELAEQGTHADEVVAFSRALAGRGWLSGQRARDLAAALGLLSEAFPAKAEVRRAHTAALEATGDDEAVVAHHAGLVRESRAGDDSRVVLARHWIHRLEAGAPSGLDSETEHWVAGGFPASVAASLTPETALLLLERVAAASGPMRAGDVGERALLKAKSLASAASIVVRTVQLLADGGEPERALAVGHKHLRSVDDADLRLTLAKIHVGAAIRIAEAESLLRPLASESGAVAAEARALRDQVVNHPSYEAERHNMMLEVERRLGVGSDKAVRCRVLFPSDRYVLAEMPGARAPAFYQHRHLRVMVTDKSLPKGLTLAEMPKGTEFLAKVVGEDDNKGDRIRVYWIGNEPVELLARPPKPNTAPKTDTGNTSPSKSQKPAQDAKSATETAAADEKPAPTSGGPTADPELEAKFGVGGDAPVLIRIDKVMMRRGLILGRIQSSDGTNDEFPHRVGIHRRYIPSALKKERFKGAVVRAKVARATTEKLRYDAVSEIELVTPAPSSDSGPKTPKSEVTAGATTPAAESATPAPEPATPAPEPATPAPEPATPAPESATPAPEPTATTPSTETGDAS